MSRNVGDKVTLRCFYKEGDSTNFYWYKQRPEHEPRLMSSHYKYSNISYFHNEFEGDRRFSLTILNRTNHLSISNIRLSDSAAYFCAAEHLYALTFAKGVFLDVRGPGSNIQAVVPQQGSTSLGNGTKSGTEGKFRFGTRSSDYEE